MPTIRFKEDRRDMIQLNQLKLNVGHDIVAASIGLAVQTLRVCVLIWSLGFCFVFIKILMPNVSIIPPWSSVFGPIYCGNFLLLSLQVRLLFRAMVCFGRGRLVTEGEYQRLVTHNKSDIIYIVEDYTSLIARGVFGLILSVPVLLLITAFEILFGNYLTSGSPSVWISFSPLIFTQIVGIGSLILIKSKSSWRGATLKVLVLSATLAFVFALQKQLSWSSAILPVWGCCALFAHSTISVLQGYCTGIYFLSFIQVISAGIYLFAILCVVTGTFLLIFKPFQYFRESSDIIIDLWLPLTPLFTAVVSLATAAVLLIPEHGRYLLATKGFGEPLPLSQSQEGWDISGDDDVFDLVLGPLKGHTSRVIEAGYPIRPNEIDAIPQTAFSDQYDSGCDSAAFNELYGGGSTTGASGAEEST